ESERQRQGQVVQAHEMAGLSTGAAQIAAHGAPAREAAQGEIAVAAPRLLLGLERQDAEAPAGLLADRRGQRLDQLGGDDEGHGRGRPGLAQKGDQVLQPFEWMAFGLGLENQQMCHGLFYRAPWSAASKSPRM